MKRTRRSFLSSLFCAPVAVATLPAASVLAASVPLPALDDSQIFYSDLINQRLAELYPGRYDSGALGSFGRLGSYHLHFTGIKSGPDVEGYVGQWLAWPTPAPVPPERRRYFYAPCPQAGHAVGAFEYDKGEVFRMGEPLPVVHWYFEDRQGYWPRLVAEVERSRRVLVDYLLTLA